MPENNYKEVVERVRAAFRSGRTLSLDFRKQQLRNLKKMFQENKKVLCDAIYADLRKPWMEASAMEVGPSITVAENFLRSLDTWAAPEDVPTVIPLDKSRVYKEPYGVVLILSPWNYPLQLVMEAFMGALAAGNTVVVKPSEVAPTTSTVIAKLLPLYVDQECYQVVLGGVPETTELLKERFDYIFYIGSTTVGRIVREAANKYLTPTTLELGGKSPCYIDHTVSLDLAVPRLLWGKLINLGQTCIAPDYVICTREVRDRLVAKVKEQLHQWYGPDPKASPDLARIVAHRHVDRLVSYLKSGTVVVGGGWDREEKWVEPTILVDVAEDSKVMQEEIFGPILPILTVDNHIHAIEIICKKEKPLALYVFSNNKDVQQLFIHQVSSGNVCINDTIFQILNPNLPFGGVGYSGMGSFRGRHSFDTFCHRKSVLSRSYNGLIDKLTSVRFPPYSEDKERRLTSTPVYTTDGPGLLHYTKQAALHLLSMATGALLLHLSLDYTSDSM